jgi:hypothetical protein
MKTHPAMRALFLALLCTTCKSADPGSPQPAPAPTPSASPAPHDALDSLDNRTKVPLLPMMAHHQRVNMRDHLNAVQEIVAAAATDDFASIEKAAERIGYSERMGAMCTHMGAGAPGFTDLALDFHRTADTIGAAAKQKDSTEVSPLWVGRWRSARAVMHGSSKRSSTRGRFARSPSASHPTIRTERSSVALQVAQRLQRSGGSAQMPPGSPAIAANHVGHGT